MSEIFWKYPKSKQEMDIKDDWRKDFKSSNPKINGWNSKNKKFKNEFQVQTSWDIFKLFLKIYWTTLSSMVKYHTKLVFEKEITWVEISITNAIYKYKNVQTQTSSRCKYKIIQFNMVDIPTLTTICQPYDLWHLKTCDFLWKYDLKFLW